MNDLLSTDDKSFLECKTCVIGAIGFYHCVKCHINVINVRNYKDKCECEHVWLSYEDEEVNK